MYIQHVIAHHILSRSAKRTEAGQRAFHPNRGRRWPNRISHRHHVTSISLSLALATGRRVRRPGTRPGRRVRRPGTRPRRPAAVRAGAINYEARLAVAPRRLGGAGGGQTGLLLLGDAGEELLDLCDRQTRVEALRRSDGSVGAAVSTGGTYWAVSGGCYVIIDNVRGDKWIMSAIGSRATGDARVA